MFLGCKVEGVKKSFVECEIAEQNANITKGFLNPNNKADGPLNTYDVNHVGQMELTRKQYHNHILVVFYLFTKFISFYPTKPLHLVIHYTQLQTEVLFLPQTDVKNTVLGRVFNNYLLVQKSLEEMEK